MLRKYVLVLVTILLSISPALATPTRPISARCLWHGDDGKKISQPCVVSSNSSAGYGTSLYIQWEDGLQTIVRDPNNTGDFATPSGTSAKFSGEYVFDRFAFPQEISLNGLGVISIHYHKLSGIPQKPEGENFRGPHLFTSNEFDRLCRDAESEAIARLSREKVSVIRSNKGSDYEQGVSPTNRTGRLSYAFEGDNSANLMNSNAILTEVSRIIFDGCRDIATVSFGVYQTGWGTTFGLEKGNTIKQWGCYEDLPGFNDRDRRSSGSFERFPKWGYDFCSI